MSEKRIAEHPILGEYQKGGLVHFTFDGKDLTGYEGESIAAALKASGVMIVNGEPNVRTCITPLEEGMTVQTQYGVETKEAWEASHNEET